MIAMKIGDRIIFDIILLIALFFVPTWWVLLGLGLVGVFLFSSFYEFIALGFMVDILYETGGVLGFGVTGFLAAFFCFFVFEKIRREVRA